ncbi:GLPGLI family protein [Flavobacterium sp. RHBU_3]|uniref:GLPGLI family protein n=1 Tax=Flavobacterium sp. RHBU_3 TaxID=3391184 RepID=UPI0039847953
MTQKLLFVLICITTYCATFSQTVTIEYSEQHNVNTASIHELPEPIRRYSTAKRYFTLVISNNESLYYKTPGQDPIIDLPIENKGQYITYPDERYFYKNLTEGLMLFEVQEDYSTLKGKDTIPTYNWDLKSTETKKIKGYRCKIATLYKNNTYYVAWYTTELPSGFGPDIFGGVPGTILSLKYGTTEYIARSIKVKGENTAIERPVFNEQTFTYAEYLEKNKKRQAEQAQKYEIKEYGGIKLILKTEPETQKD